MSKEIIEFPFIRYPRALIDNSVYRGISIEARTLFAILLDRFGLSNKNSEIYSDENGGVYVIYTVDEICEKFGFGRTKALALFRELESSGLISRKRTNGCKPSRIYIMPHFFNDLKSDFAKSENDTLQSPKNEPCKVRESASSYNNISYNEYSYIESSITEAERTEEKIREQIEYDCIVHDGNRKLVDEIVMIISDIFCGTTPTVRVGRDNLPRGVVISRLRKLDSEHILYIISEIEHNTVKIRNMKSYLITSLYNTPATMESTVAAEFAYHNHSV